MAPTQGVRRPAGAPSLAVEPDRRFPTWCHAGAARFILGAPSETLQGRQMSWRHSIALALVVLSFAASLEAAEPEFKVGVVTASRVYERDRASVVIGGARTPAATEWISRVTIALDGIRYTGEWEPKTTISASAKDFPRGSDVPAAVTRNRLLLKHPDGSVVTARLVRVQRPQEDADDERD
jgi:hypothetical protein